MIPHPVIALDQWSELPRVSGIYRIIHADSGREYVGSAKDIHHRAGKHFRDLIRGSHHSSYLLRTFQKYGSGRIAFQVIEAVEDCVQLLAREQHHIDIRMPAFNSAPVAGSCAGVKHTEATREKRKAATIRRWSRMSDSEKLQWAKKSSSQMRDWWASATPEQRDSKSQTARGIELGRIKSMTDEDRSRHMASLKARASNGGKERAKSITTEEMKAVLAAQLCWRDERKDEVSAAALAMRATKRKSGKLDTDKVRNIRRRRADGETLKSIARDMGISQALACGVANGNKWGDVQ